jgi:hypothetical protein
MTPRPKRRDVLKLGAALGAFTTLDRLPRFVPAAAPAGGRPAAPSLVPASEATTLWYQSPGSESAVMQQGLPVGNGRLGAMVTGDPASDAYFLTEVSLWTGGANANLGGDGQFPYDAGDFGSFQSLAKAHVNVPAHSASAVSGYRRMLDLSNGYVSATYQYGGVTYTREAYASHPDDVVVVRLKQSGGGTYTGGVVLNGTHGETTQADSGTMTASFAGSLDNGLAYACVAAVAATGGQISVSGAQVTFTGCREVVVVFCGSTNYTPNAAAGYKDTGVNPLNVALGKARAAVAVPGDSLLATHIADYQELYNALTVNLGASTATQRAMDTPSRLAARAASGATPDPELEASYLQFGRYLAITGSRGTLPANLQGVWLDNDNPAWMSDYHTDINLQMNYWLPDRAGLPSCFEVFADYCLAQLPGWTATTQSLFQDPRNGFRNSSGRVAGWTAAISENIWGGGGWWWHPAGGAWISNALYDHYLYTLDTAYLRKIYPLLKGACQFWEARLITDPGTGLLIDDSDWSPEQGPTNAKGITYAQELEDIAERDGAALALGGEVTAVRFADRRAHGGIGGAAGACAEGLAGLLLLDRHPRLPGSGGLQVLGQRGQGGRGVDARWDAQVEAGSYGRLDRGGRADHGRAVDAQHGQCGPGPEHVGHSAVAGQLDPGEHARVLAELLGGIGGARPGLIVAQPVHGDVAVVIVQGGEHAYERGERVGGRTAEHARVQRPLERLDGHDHGDHPAQGGGERRYTHGDVAAVGDQDGVGPEQAGVPGHEVLQAAGALFLRAPAHQREAEWQVGAERAQGGQVHDDVALAVGGPASVPASVPLGQLPDRRGPGGVVERRLHVVVAVQQYGRSPGWCGTAGDHGLAAIDGVVQLHVGEAHLAEGLGDPSGGLVTLLGRKLPRVGHRPEGHQLGQVGLGSRHQPADPGAQFFGAHGNAHRVSSSVSQCAGSESVRAAPGPGQRSGRVPRPIARR